MLSAIAVRQDHSTRVRLLEHPPGPGAVGHRARRMPQQPLGSAVPNHIPAVRIDHVKTVVQVFQEIQVRKNLAKRVRFVHLVRCEDAIPCGMAFGSLRSNLERHAFRIDPPRQREHDIAVELRPSRGHQNLEGLFVRLSFPVNLRRGQGLVGVRDRENPRPLVHLAAETPAVVVDPVEIKMRLHHDVQDLLVHPAGLEHVDADVLMERHQFRFVGAEFARLEQDMIRHPDLSHIVQKRRHFQHLQFPFAPAEIFADARAQQSHAPAVHGDAFVAVMQGREQTSQDRPRNRPVEGIGVAILFMFFRPPGQRHQSQQNSRRVRGMRPQQRGAGSRGGGGRQQIQKRILGKGIVGIGSARGGGRHACLLKIGRGGNEAFTQRWLWNSTSPIPAVTTNHRQT